MSHWINRFIQWINRFIPRQPRVCTEACRPLVNVMYQEDGCNGSQTALCGSAFGCVCIEENVCVCVCVCGWECSIFKVDTGRILKQPPSVSRIWPRSDHKALNTSSTPGGKITILTAVPHTNTHTHTHTPLPTHTHTMSHTNTHTHSHKPCPTPPLSLPLNRLNSVNDSYSSIFDMSKSPPIGLIRFSSSSLTWLQTLLSLHGSTSRSSGGLRRSIGHHRRMDASRTWGVGRYSGGIDPEFIDLAVKDTEGMSL